MNKSNMEYFYYCMKISLMKIPQKSDVFLRFYHKFSLSYMFKVDKDKTYIIMFTVYEIKQIYLVGKPNIKFYKFELE